LWIFLKDALGQYIDSKTSSRFAQCPDDLQLAFSSIYFTLGSEHVSVDTHALERDMRASFEAGLPRRVERASAIGFQTIIPAHWFAAAASECAGMYIAGYFYGAISVAQAYVEALCRYLAEHHRAKVAKDAQERCRYPCG
jgi:hypothetical protein